MSSSAFTTEFLKESAQLIAALDGSIIDRMADGLGAVRDQGGRLFILGVGGSAGHASHAVNDFRKICAFEAYTPTDNVSELTARVNDEGWDAMAMLDWEEGRVYEITAGVKVRVLPTDVAPALEAAVQQTDGLKRTETQRFIGDRYDRFLFLVSQLQAAVRSGLVRKDDVQFPLSWYVEKRLCGHKKLLLA